MKTETFSDGSTIDTDEVTGNRTVFGALAHREYFKRLAAERFNDSTPLAVISSCTNLDGSPKAQLIRRVNGNPITREQFGEYSYEVWSDTDPANVLRCRDYESARKHYRSFCLAGTNGIGA